MRFGMNMLMWTADGTLEPIRPIYAKIKKIGYDTVEIPLFNLDTPKLADLGKLLDDLGLERTSVTVLSPETNLINPDPAVRQKGVDYLKKVLDNARALGATMLVGPLYAALGAFTGKGPTADEWKWATEGLRAAAVHGKSVGVKLGIEFLNRFEIYLLNTAADAARMVQEVNHPYCRMMFDTFHSHIEEKDPAKAFLACSKSVIHVHISENDRSTPGQGNVRWKEMIAAFKKRKFAGPYVVEAFGLALPELAAATKIWRRMYKTEEKLCADALAFMKKNLGST
jgi:D-psicose/D-tagatose/L-ribulose 3-epimerase